ncbi:hypothetical protein [Neobacillus kokaensis]|uniref:Uncharacterized protein n=1 Tax=Neobacillus kokaensis TaxID=2759023 RepID=A0ABQ3N3I3_9BACI|nr:hypothetical protein [Neobacillus kokaensis]GHH98548.1 hypothetical protein AM1BK_20910 [Neobacillus kokaensis]
MKIFIMILFIICVILFLGSAKYFFALKKPGVYPPKQVLKSRAIVLAGGGGMFLLIAFMFSYFM